MNTRTLIISLTAICLALPSLPASAAPETPAANVKLDPLVCMDGIWESHHHTFVVDNRSFGFAWQSELSQTAQSTLKGLTLFGLPVTQALAHFNGDKLNSIRVIFYDRGDNGDVTKSKFNDFVNKAVSAINAFTKTKGALRPAKPSDVVKISGMIWNTKQSQIVLECSDNGTNPKVLARQIPYRAEFVRLTITPPPKKTNFFAQAFEKKGGQVNAKSRARKLANGDTIIDDIPMVDQGRKGYCVVAATSRVLRYYGKNVDENELAQIANSDAKNGTSLQAMQKALKELTAKLGVQSRAVLPFNDARFFDLLRNYNTQARAKGKPIIPDSGSVDVGNVYDAMDKKILIKIRATDAAKNQLMQIVKEYIDQGKPLLWSVTLGIIPEKAVTNLQGTGGHMRLIIGYNTQTKEIVYSDSWGRGFENERMTLKHAVAISDALYLVEPIGS